MNVPPADRNDGFAPINQEELEKARAEVRNPRRSVLEALGKITIPAGGTVLDAGCGNGVHLGLFADRVGSGGRVIGLDSNPDAVARARTLWSDEIAAGRIMVEQAELPNIPTHIVPDDSCDVVWTALVIHHVERPAESIQTLVSKLKPGGTIAILDGEFGPGFPTTIWPPEIEHLLREASLRAWQERHGYLHGEFQLAPYAIRSVPKWLAQAGIQPRDISVVSDAILPPLTLADLESILGWLRNQVNRLAEYLAPRDLSRVADLFDPESSHYMFNQPGFFWVRSMLLVTGRKMP